MAPSFAWVGVGSQVPLLGVAGSGKSSGLQRGEPVKGGETSPSLPHLVTPLPFEAVHLSDLSSPKVLHSLGLTRGLQEPQFPLWTHHPPSDLVPSSPWLPQFNWSCYTSIVLLPGLCSGCALYLGCSFPRHPCGQLLQTFTQMSPSKWRPPWPPYLKLAFPITPGVFSPYSALFLALITLHNKILYGLLITLTIHCPLYSLGWKLQEGSDCQFVCWY